MRQQAAADEAVALHAMFLGAKPNRSGNPKSQLVSQQTPSVSQVILSSDLAHDPVGESAAISVRDIDRPQYADVQRIELGESYRSDARCNIGLDDTKRIGAILERSHKHGHVRPWRPRDALDESREARIPMGEQNITTLKHTGEGLWIGAWTRNRVLDRLRKVKGQCGK
jgi:hypothetical protein